MSGPSIVFPSRGIYDKKFRYRNSVETDVTKTFQRAKRQQAQAERRAARGQQSLELDTNVLPLFARGAK